MGLNTRQFALDRTLLEANLKQLGQRSSRDILYVMRDEADKIADLARQFAPIDEGDLTRAIEVYESRTGINNRTVVTVWVNPEYADGRGYPIWKYALLMHEGLAPYGSGAYQLGPASLAKDGGSGQVGGKFLERAVRARIGVIGKRINALARRVFA